MLFKLVRHKKFGPGVVLSEDSEVFSVYFADKQKRRVLFFPQFFSDKKVTLSEFVQFELYEGIFDAFTKQKAREYTNEEHINRVSILGYKATGIVNGTRQYFVSIIVKNNTIDINCDCPVRALCKHEYAFFKMIKMNFFRDGVRELEIQSAKTFEKEEIYMLSRLKSYCCLDHYIDIISKLRTDKKDILKEYISVFLNLNDPRIDNLIFYGISPLFYDEKFKNDLFSLAENDENSRLLINKAYKFFTDSFEKPKVDFSAIALTLKAITLNDVFVLLEINKHYYESERFLAEAFIYLIKTKDLELDQLYQIANSHFFKGINFLDFFREINKMKKNKILFIDYVHFDDEFYNQYDINSLIPFISMCSFKNNLVDYFTKNFDKINKSEYQRLVNSLYDLNLNSFNKTKVLKLIERLPNNLFLIQLFENSFISRY